MDFLYRLVTPINIIFTLGIAYLVMEDLKSAKTEDYKDYKSLIISVGI